MEVRKDQRSFIDTVPPLERSLEAIFVVNVTQAQMLQEDAHRSPATT